MRFTPAAALALSLSVTAITRADPFIGANFSGGSGNTIGLEPPDTMGAPGLDHYVQFINGRFGIYNKGSGLQVGSFTSFQFWTNAGITFGGSDGRSDPRVVFDPQSNRWFASQIDLVGSSLNNPNNFLLAVSNTSDPTQGFKAFRFSAASNFGDFDTLGINADGVYLSTNNFPLGAGETTPPTNTTIVSIPKSDLLLPTPTIAHKTQWTTESLNNEGNVVQPAYNLGSITNGHAALLGMNNTSTIALQRTNLFNAAQLTAGAATLGASVSTTIPPAPNPPLARQPGGTGTLDAIDNRLAQVIQIGNTLWTAQGTNIGGHAGIQWYKIDEPTGALLQTGQIADANFDFIAPSIAANANGDVVIGYTRSGPTLVPSAYASVGTTSGGVVSFAAPMLLKSGAASYAGTRWGDYSATYTDPTDPGIFWTNQEWATTGGNNWATQMTEILINSPGEARWKTAASGSFNLASNYFAGAAPDSGSHVIFSRATPGTGYTVSFNPGATSISRLSVRQGSVTLSFGGATLNVANDVTIGEFDGSPTLSITGGTLATGSINIPRGTLSYQTGSLSASGALTVSGGQMLLTPGKDKTPRVNSVAVTGTGKIDLADNNMIVDYDGSSPIASLRTTIGTGYAGGSWSGNGITSSSAAAAASSPHRTALGYAEQTELGIGSFAGQSLDSTSIVIRYTLAGDSDLNTMVDLTDFTFLAANFNGTAKDWFQGDYNYDGNVDLTDFTLLASNFNQTLTAGSAGSLGATVPEPTAAAMASLATLALRRRRSFAGTYDPRS
jgi:hypothetical protein